MRESSFTASASSRRSSIAFHLGRRRFRTSSLFGMSTRNGSSFFVLMLWQRSIILASSS
ncbi:MAG TPA: hypothetical protein P5290_01700 [Candidatus Methanomethylicus sp.]|nr:hypothetical protein [Candidatus Methanomethylicus sp.]HRR54042.1 hypothetical protein [Candidatus Methanomethylicus sp.]